jgi:hypothetical protein
LLACVYASPRRPQKVVFCMQGALSEADRDSRGHPCGGLSQRSRRTLGRVG